MGSLIILGVLLPLVGLFLAYREPPGLFGAPELTFGRVWPLLLKSLALSFLVSCFSLVIGTWFAWCETRLHYHGRRILSFLSILALATPSYLIATIVREEFAPAGIFGRVFGLEGTFTGFWPSVLVLTVACTPYVHLLAAAALRRCPSAEEEAARSLGATSARVLKTVIAPRLRPTWAFALVLVGLYVVSDFGAVAILDCEVLTWELYKARDGREAVALAFGLLLVVLPLLGAVRLLKSERFEERTQVHRRVDRKPMSPGLLTLTLVLHGMVIGLGVILPFVSLLKWIRSGLVNQVDFSPVLAPGMTTFIIAGLSALVAVVASAIVAYLAHVVRPRTAAWIENAVYLTSSLPGILVAVGILKLIVGLKRQIPHDAWPWLEGLGLFLLAGYIMRFLSQGYAAIYPGILRLDQSQIEAARSLGSTRARWIQRVVLPSLKPSFLAAYALLFLSIAKELPITLMLIPLGYTTLSYRIFDGQQEGSLPDVGLAGMTLLVMAFTLQVLITRWSRDDTA
ncbi:MAG: ABC transporter permease subunit [Myxococcota bacterium]|nr:ABC transporter permease subunit [Myxococcota bacterium]